MSTIDSQNFGKYSVFNELDALVLTNRVIEGQSRSTKNTPKMPTHREQASRRFAPRKNESTYWVKECYRKQNPQATPLAVVFSIPVGGLLKVSGITKNGTPSVPTTILDLGQTVFSYCLICPRGRVRLVKNRETAGDGILFPVA